MTCLVMMVVDENCDASAKQIYPVVEEAPSWRMRIGFLWPLNHHETTSRRWKTHGLRRI